MSRVYRTKNESVFPIINYSQTILGLRTNYPITKYNELNTQKFTEFFLPQYKLSERIVHIITLIKVF